MKIKIWFYSNEATYFYDKEMPKAGSNYTCLAVFVIDSALKKDEYYYLQVFLNEFKYIEKEVIRYIIGDPKLSSDESDEE